MCFETTWEWNVLLGPWSSLFSFLWFYTKRKTKRRNGNIYLCSAESATSIDLFRTVLPFHVLATILAQNIWMLFLDEQTCERLVGRPSHEGRRRDDDERRERRVRTRGVTCSRSSSKRGNDADERTSKCIESTEQSLVFARSRYRRGPLEASRREVGWHVAVGRTGTNQPSPDQPRPARVSVFDHNEGNEYTNIIIICLEAYLVCLSALLFRQTRGELLSLPLSMRKMWARDRPNNLSDVY